MSDPESIAQDAYFDKLDEIHDREKIDMIVYIQPPAIGVHIHAHPDDSDDDLLDQAIEALKDPYNGLYDTSDVEIDLSEFVEWEVE